MRCQDTITKNIVAVKVIKNKPAYFNQALVEIRIAHLVRVE
jgi:dual specificity protein kinase YAK1